MGFIFLGIFFITLITGYLAIRRGWVRFQTAAWIAITVNLIAGGGYALTETDNLLHILCVASIAGLGLTGTMIIMAAYFERNMPRVDQPSSSHISENNT